MFQANNTQPYSQWHNDLILNYVMFGKCPPPPHHHRPCKNSVILPPHLVYDDLDTS